MASEKSGITVFTTSKPKIDELKLIEMIKARPAMYDQKHPSHRHRPVIDRLWKEISTEVGAPVYELRNKWHVLRCCFNRSMKEMETGFRKTGRPWHLYSAMLFIKDHLRKRPSPHESLDNRAPSPPNPESPLSQAPNNVPANEEVECDFTPPETNSSSPPKQHHLLIYDDGTTQIVPTKRIKTDQFSTSGENFLLQPPSKIKGVTEANELFLRSILHDMSKLKPAKLRHFKTFVITKLTHLLDEQDAETMARDLTDGLANAYDLETDSVET